RSTLAMYPDGLAARSNEPAFVALKKLPAFEKICEAAGGYGERVEDPAALPRALQTALSGGKDEGREGLLNGICGAPGTAGAARVRCKVRCKDSGRIPPCAAAS